MTDALKSLETDLFLLEEYTCFSHSGLAIKDPAFQKWLIQQGISFSLNTSH